MFHVPFSVLWELHEGFENDAVVSSLLRSCIEILSFLLLSFVFLLFLLFVFFFFLSIRFIHSMLSLLHFCLLASLLGTLNYKE